MEQSVRVCVCVSVWCNHNNATVFITKIIGFGWRLNFRDACSHQKCQPNYRIFHFFLWVFFGWESASLCTMFLCLLPLYHYKWLYISFYPIRFFVSNQWHLLSIYLHCTIVELASNLSQIQPNHQLVIWINIDRGLYCFKKIVQSCF